MDKLVVLNTQKDLVALRDLYRVDWPANCVGFYLIDNYIKWYEIEPQLELTTIYSLNGNWQENGLFLIVDGYQLFAHSLKPADEDLRKAIKLIDWSNGGYKITALPLVHQELVRSTLTELGVFYREREMIIYRTLKEEVLKWEKKSCPPGFHIKPVPVEDCEIMDTNWHSKQPGSLIWFKRLVKFNISIGVYTDDTNELVAWCTRCQGGFFGGLHVLEKYRRHGLATLLTNLFAHEVVKTGDDFLTMANTRNDASNGLFRKLNMEAIGGGCHFLMF